jgi:hypothetical protein
MLSPVYKNPLKNKTNFFGYIQSETTTVKKNIIGAFGCGLASVITNNHTKK